MKPQTTSDSSECRTTALSQTLHDLTMERDGLFLALHTKLSSPQPYSLLQAQSAYLPSIHAHTQSIPVLTKAKKAALLAEAQSTIQSQIKALNQYNELKDVGLSLIGLIAEARGVRIKDCLEEFGVADCD